MKTITIGILVVVMIAIGVNIFGTKTVTYVKEGVTTEVVKEVTPDWASDAEAVQAAKDVIRKKELQAELGQLDADIKKLQDRRKEVTGELTTY